VFAAILEIDPAASKQKAFILIRYSRFYKIITAIHEKGDFGRFPPFVSRLIGNQYRSSLFLFS